MSWYHLRAFSRSDTLTMTVSTFGKGVGSLHALTVADRRGLYFVAGWTCTTLTMSAVLVV